MTVGGLALPFIDVQLVALVTEDAVSCDMVTCCVSSYLTVTSSSDDGVGPIGAILPRGGISIAVSSYLREFSSC